MNNSQNKKTESFPSDNLLEKIQEKNLEIENLTRILDQKEIIIREKEQRISEIVNSLRWKVPNFIYKMYIKKIKKHIPKIIFKTKDKLIAIFRKLFQDVKKAKLVFSFKKYFFLFRMAWIEYRINGIEGLKFSVRRYFKKKKGHLIAAYPMVNDYVKDLVTIGILTKNKLDLIEPCIESIQNNLSEKYQIEILIGDTGSTEKKVWEYYKRARKKYNNIKIIKFGGYLFSKNYNDLFRSGSNGQYLVFLNNDTLAKSGWIDNLIDPLKDKKIGVVGGKLLYKDETIQHAGMEIHPNGNGTHYYVKELKNIREVNYKALVPAVTFACVAMRHDVFNRFQLSEDFREEAQDTDFCFRLKDAGFEVLYNPDVEIYHLESSTRNTTKGSNDRNLLQDRWKNKINKILSEQQRIPYDEGKYNDYISIIRSDGLGDLLMGMSSFKKLKIKYPEKNLILATFERNIEMVKEFKIFDEFIPIPNGQHYAPLPIPQKSKVYNLTNLEIKITPIRGEVTDNNKIHRHDFFTKELGLDSDYIDIKMPDYQDAKNKVLRLIDSNVLKKNNLVVFNMLSTNPARSWWAPYYPKLIEAVEDMGFVPVIVGTENNNYFEGKKLINLVGKTKTITEYIEAIKLGDYVISTDTSACHIAGLAGVPFLAIFTGGVLPGARLKYYSKYEVVEPEGLKCYPCWDQGCQDPDLYWKKDPCRLMIKPEMVIEKFKTLIKKYPVQ